MTGIVDAPAFGTAAREIAELDRAIATFQEVATQIGGSNRPYYDYYSFNDDFGLDLRTADTVYRKWTAKNQSSANVPDKSCPEGDGFAQCITLQLNQKATTLKGLRGNASLTAPLQSVQTVTDNPLLTKSYAPEIFNATLESVADHPCCQITGPPEGTPPYY